MAERLPSGVYDTDSIRPAYLPNALEPNGIHHPVANGDCHSLINGSRLASSTGVDSAPVSRTHSPSQLLRDPAGNNETNRYNQSQGLPTSSGRDDYPDVKLSNGTGGIQVGSRSVLEAADSKESAPFPDGENGMKPGNSAALGNGNQVEAEWIEQYEPGVFITLVALRDGTRDLKRVRFSRRRFGEHQAETWWSENREKVYERYNVRGSEKSSVSGQAARLSEGAVSPSSQR